MILIISCSRNNSTMMKYEEGVIPMAEEEDDR